MTQFRVARYTLEIFDNEGAALMGDTRARLHVEAEDITMISVDFHFYDSAPGTATDADGNAPSWLPISVLPTVMQMLRDYDSVTLHTGAMVPGESLSVFYSYGKG